MKPFAARETISQDHKSLGPIQESERLRIRENHFSFRPEKAGWFRCHCPPGAFQRRAPEPSRRADSGFYRYLLKRERGVRGHLAGRTAEPDVRTSVCFRAFR